MSENLISETIWHRESVDRQLASANLLSFGVSFLDDAIRGIFPNDLIVLGARTGRGKTEFATSIALNAAEKFKNVLFYALEADEFEIHRRLKYRMMSQLYFQHFNGKFPWPRYVDWLADSLALAPDFEPLEKAVERDFNLKASSLRICYRGGRYPISKFIAEIESLEASDAHLIIVDHLHYFDLEAKNEMDGIKAAMHELRNLAVHRNKAVLLLAHLRKSGAAFPTIDDFHGHSDIVKVATNVILMAPAPAVQTKGSFYPTYFHVAKSRKAAETTNHVAILGFDREKNAYDESYYLATHQGIEQPKLLDHVGDIPKWAKHANRQGLGGNYAGGIL